MFTIQLPQLELCSLGCHSTFTCSQTWKPAAQNCLTLIHMQTSTHFIAFPTHTFPNLTMTQISTGLPKLVVFSSLSLYLMTIFQRLLHLLKAELKVHLLPRHFSFYLLRVLTTSSSLFVVITLAETLLKELLLSKIYSVAWSPRAACCHICQECIPK